MRFRSPVYHVTAVPVEKIEPNTYNPNAVAPPELKLLYDSIKQDGYTMPVVCYYDKERDKYILVDGFHRYRIMLDYPDIYARENGMLPVSIIDKPLDHRMAIPGSPTPNSYWRRSLPDCAITTSRSSRLL